MTALSITASQVLPTNGDPTITGVAGEAITAGQVVYYNASGGNWKLAQGDGTAAEAGQDGYGIALTSAPGAGQPVVVATGGHRVTLGAGAAPAAGEVYYIGDTAGALVQVGDVGSGDRETYVCQGIGANKVKVSTDAYNAGAVKA